MAVAFVPYMADLLRYESLYFNLQWNFIINFTFNRHIEFSTPLDEGEWRMIMLRPQESASGAGLLAPFDKIVWYLILVALIVTGPIIFCIVWLYCRFAKLDEEQQYCTLSQCIWYVYGECNSYFISQNIYLKHNFFIKVDWWNRDRRWHQRLTQ